MELSKGWWQMGIIEGRDEREVEVREDLVGCVGEGENKR